jgi:acetyltransferase-like isoleucine patch superfamily enzyme
MVFLGKGVELYARRGHGRLVIGKFVHIGDHTAVRAHEGTVRIGDKAVLASRVTVNSYLHVEIGAATLVGDDVYICDFDHRFEALDRPIKDQGIVKAPVRIGRDVWLGTKATVLRGIDIGDGCVIGANAVVTRDVPAYSVAAGIPAAILKSRLPEPAGQDGAATASPLIGDVSRVTGIDRADAARRAGRLRPRRRSSSGP